VAIFLSTSGLAALVPYRYAVAKRQLEETFGLKVIEAPHTFKDPDWLYRNPKARADDLQWALENDQVKAIFTTLIISRTTVIL
jgi:muramoyltetrapeptide carboxypeptidase LdcA involved in peptidoglycan recycling